MLFLAAGIFFAAIPQIHFCYILLLFYFKMVLKNIFVSHFRSKSLSIKTNRTEPVM